MNNDPHPSCNSQSEYDGLLCCVRDIIDVIYDLAFGVNTFVPA